MLLQLTFHSKLNSHCILGVDNIFIKPSSYMIYLGDPSGVTVSHISVIIGPVKQCMYMCDCPRVMHYIGA